MNQTISATHPFCYYPLSLSLFLYMYIYLCSKVLSGKKIFNGINERDFFIQETGSLLWKTTKVLARYILSKVHSVITHRCRCRVHPCVLFATTALVLLASSLARTGQRPYLSYLSCSRPPLSLSRPLSVFYAPFSFAGQPPLFQPTSL